MTNKIYMNPALSVEDKVRSLLAEMTVEEKTAQVCGIWATDLIDTTTRQFYAEKAAPHIKDGIGHITRIGAVSLLFPHESVKVANEMQRYLVENTRLGIPAIVHEESCAGYLARGATTFPQALSLAATWQPELVEKMAGHIRQQLRSVGAHHALAPVLDVVRDARWGRVEETFGEDPYLVSRMGVAYINGLQNHDLREGVVATAKHFVGYGMSEGGMNWAPAHIPERELREIFLVPFIAAIREANVASVMNAYHEHDGVPCGSSKELMVDLLRDELGFEGVVASDYFTLPSFINYHHVAKDAQEAAKYGLEAGIDVELPTRDCYGKPLLDALAAGTIEIGLVDVSVQRVLTQKFQLGLFDNPYADEGRVAEVYNTDEQINLSRQLAEKSMVLLKNAGNILPLSQTLKSIAVIGPHADSVRLMQGDYHYPSHMEGIFNPDQSADAPTPATETRLDWTEFFPPSTTVLQGIQALVSPETQVFYAKGCEVTGQDTSGFAAAVAAAEQAEIAIVVVGDKSGLSKGSTVGESIDRATLDLFGVQQQLVEVIHATGTPTVVVLMNGRPVTLNWIAEHIPGVLVAWFPAQEGGSAIANVLFGKASPGGRLPMSFPRGVGQIPVYYNHKPSGGRTHWQGDYADMSAKPLFPFGHGLSYAEFEYRDLHISLSKDSVQIQVTVKNCGKWAGDEVVQLYLHDPIASVTRPVKELKGFERINLQPEEATTLTFEVAFEQLAFYDRQMNLIIEPGEIEVMVGSSSEDIRLRGKFEI